MGHRGYHQAFDGLIAIEKVVGHNLLHHGGRRIDGRIRPQALKPVALGQGGDLKAVGPAEAQRAVLEPRPGIVGTPEPEAEGEDAPAKRQVGVFVEIVSRLKVDGFIALGVVTGVDAVIARVGCG